jgi:hypothetical protein
MQAVLASGPPLVEGVGASEVMGATEGLGVIDGVAAAEVHPASVRERTISRRVDIGCSFAGGHGTRPDDDAPPRIRWRARRHAADVAE